MTTKYRINPCRACEKKLGKTYCNVNTMNDCCYGTLAAFSGVTSSNAIVNDASAENCKKCVQKVMDNMGVFGRSQCDLKLSAPPLWIQSPHYLPSLLNGGMEPKKARDECMKMCETTKYAGECQENCQTDYDAIETIASLNKVVENFEQNEKTIGINYALIFVLSLVIIMTILLVKRK